MSKYRPNALPKGIAAVSSENSAVPPVRTRDEIKREWEERRRKQDEDAAMGQVSSPDPTADGGGGVSEPTAAIAEAATAVNGHIGTAAGQMSVGSVLSVLSVPSGSIDDGAVDDDGLVSLPANRDANGYVSIPGFTEPMSDDPKERLDHYARGVAAVEYAARANEQATNQQRVIIQGLYFLAIKKEQLWEAAGLPSFDALVQERFGFSGDYANKQIRAMPVVRALKEATTMELKEKHLRALVPVHKKHGDEAVRKTWTEALRKGKVTEKSLKEAAYFLGYGEPLEKKARSSRGQQSLQKAEGTERIQKAAAVFGSIRALMQQDEELARQEAIKLWNMVEELRRELGIEAMDARSGS
ncbi:hypothetical protein [Streptomyces sp. NPDC002537]